MRMKEYAVHSDYAHFRKYADADGDENIIHKQIFAKNCQLFGQKRVSLALFSILSAQNIIIVHPTWFYPSFGIKKRSQNHLIF